MDGSEQSTATATVASVDVSESLRMLKAAWFDNIPTRVTPNAPASGALLAPKASIRLLGLAYFVLLFARAAAFVLLFARAAVFVLAVAFAFTTLCDYTQTIKHIHHEHAHR